jgi:hypothetical protein
MRIGTELATRALPICAHFPSLSWERLQSVRIRMDTVKIVCDGRKIAGAA